MLTKTKSVARVQLILTQFVLKNLRYRLYQLFLITSEEIRSILPHIPDEAYQLLQIEELKGLRPEEVEPGVLAAYRDPESELVKLISALDWVNWETVYECLGFLYFCSLSLGSLLGKPMYELRDMQSHYRDLLLKTQGGEILATLIDYLCIPTDTPSSQRYRLEMLLECMRKPALSEMIGDVFEGERVLKIARLRLINLNECGIRSGAQKKALEAMVEDAYSVLYA